MAHFDRLDICEAWYVFLTARPCGRTEYGRLSQLLTHFKPRPGLRVETLTENGLEIYLQLTGETRPFIDQGDHCGHIFEMWAGAYGQKHILVRAGAFEDALESLFEWCDDNAPGVLTNADDDEPDMTMCGHTTLKNGNAIPSWEWGGSAVKI